MAAEPGHWARGDPETHLARPCVRGIPDPWPVARSRWPQFNGLVLRELLRDSGIGYEHLPETGGKTRPKPEDLARGVDRIVEIASEVRTVIMCSESQPLSHHKTPRANCHRVGMLAPMLRARGIERIIHILPDGRSTEFDESAVQSIW